MQHAKEGRPEPIKCSIEGCDILVHNNKITSSQTWTTSFRWTWRIWRCTWQPTLVRRSSVVYVVSGWGVWRTLFWNLNSAWILNWILAWIFRCVADHLRTVHKQGKQKPCSQVLLSLSWVGGYCWRAFHSVRQNILQLLWPKSPYWESTRGEKVSFSHQTHLKYIPFFILDYRSICPECGKPFTRLEGHLKSVHNIKDKELTVVETINTVNKSMTWYWEEPKNKMRTKNDESTPKDLIKEKIKIWLTLRCWGNSSIPEGRFSKWF